MNSYQLIILIISLSAGFAYINHRYLKMPFVIGLFFLSMLFSLSILSSKYWAYSYFENIKEVIAQVNLSKYILEIMLGFLLFAGSLHVEWSEIKKQLKTIGIFAIVGVIASTFIIGSLFYGISGVLGIEISFIYCLLFGALISPTDPIAVLGILTKANVPKRIETTIVGESLFNDGIGVVVFIALLEILNTGSEHFSLSHFGLLFVQESIGGILFGLIAGYLLHKLLSTINHYETEVILTLAFVMLGYELCLWLHLSGALAMVIMGLFVGNYKQDQAMSDITMDYVDKFWELLDVILNAILFILIAFVLVLIDIKGIYILMGFISILIVLVSRWIVVFLPKTLLPKTINMNNKEANLIVWGGLRGGLSIALVMSLPESEAKEVLMVATYTCVVFSILVQGLSIENVAKSLLKLTLKTNK
ncbi:MAG: sodium:proton antiporter [Saprospiraceae bacterium]|nr:sodium:proton antiporter [Saprospiraceae bacterium]